MANKIISVRNLKKYYQVHQKEVGLTGSIKSLFSRKYYDVKAVDDISFDIEEGELIGFIGPNGAGKTTTLKMLSGLLYPTSGKVDVLGFTPSQRKSAYQKQFSLVMGQKNQLWWDLPAMESLNLNKAIYEVSDEKFKKTLEELVQLLEVEDILKVQVRKLSLGQRMKMELIAALIHSPKILFLDEPTIGLDVVMQKKLRDFIKEYNLKYKATIILTSHYMDDVKELCKRVIVIDHGKVLFDGPLEKIIQKYADSKTLTLVLEKPVDLEKLESFGKVVEYEHPKVVYSIKRSKVPETTAVLLKELPVDDLSVEDVEIEEVIRQLFQSA